MSNAPEILFADDDRIMRTSYASAFSSEGFAVRAVKNGEEAVAAFRERRPDVVVLDMMMPKMNGLDTCKAIRAHDAAVPILFLSCLADDTKKLRAYDSGADDYVEKATNIDVVVAKIRAMLRRTATSSQQVAATFDRLKLGTVEVDLRSCEVFISGTPSAHLTKTECDILKLLVAQQGQTITRNELISKLRGDDFVCEDAMLYSPISRLRKKLGPAGDLVSSTRDAGYRLVR